MNDVLAFAERHGLQAEVYWATRSPLSTRYQGGQPTTVIDNTVDQCTVRIVRDGKLGVACGTRPTLELAELAMQAAAEGAEAPFRFAGMATPRVRPAPPLERPDPEALLELGDTLRRHVLEERPDLPLVVDIASHEEHVRVATTEGFSGQERSGFVSLTVGAPFAQSGTGLWRSSIHQAVEEDVRPLAEEFLEWFAWGDQVVTPASGRLPVLLAPEAAFLVGYPLGAALAGDSLWQRTSPLENRLGERVLCENLTVSDAPLDPADPLGRSFDDEGTPCRSRALVDQGVLVGYLLDRRTGALLGEGSTGNGFKRGLFGGGPWAAPTPWPARLTIQEGADPWRALLGTMERGLLVYGGMGFHSSNYLQGNFSIQALGYYVEDGRVTGRLTGTMLAGNIYQDFFRVHVSREQKRLTQYVAPYLLVPELQVAGGR